MRNHVVGSVTQFLNYKLHMLVKKHPIHVATDTGHMSETYPSTYLSKIIGLHLARQRSWVYEKNGGLVFNNFLLIRAKSPNLRVNSTQACKR